MSNLELTMSFSDHTILETDGKYDDVKKLMDEELHKDCTWMVRSELTIESQLGSFCRMMLHFKYDGNIIIVSFETTTPDVYYNPDIRCLSAWSQENGWKIPQPSADLVRSNKEFWKHFWEVQLVDSDYLEKVIGKRTIVDIAGDDEDGDWID